MKPVRLTEGARWAEHELTPGQAAGLSRSQIVRITPGPRDGLWLLRDNGYVGAARTGRGLDAVEVRIAPKTPIDRLLFMLGYARHQHDWRQEDVNAGTAPDLVPALAYAFARAAERALRQGLLLGYRQREEALPAIRGRIREADQLRRRYGLPIPVEVRYDDYTTDITENQLLLGAAIRLQQLPGVPGHTRALLRHVTARLAGITRALPGQELPAWHKTRLNRRYHTALCLAELVLRGASYELNDGTAVRVDGLLLTMWQVFEDFVTTALTEALRPRGGRCRPQDTRHHLDRDRLVALRPDLVYDTRDETGRMQPTAVIDAKYKIDNTPGEHTEDLYQMLAYCTALGLHRGHLVYAAASAPQHVHRIRRTDIEIIQHALDLSQPPGALMCQIHGLAADIAP